MKVLCDVHIAKKVVNYFQKKDIESLHINDILDKWHTKDQDIANYADEHGFVVLTKDADFRNSHFIQGKPKKVLRISLGNISTSDLIKLLSENIETIKTQMKKEKCFIEINKERLKIFNQ